MSQRCPCGHEDKLTEYVLGDVKYQLCRLCIKALDNSFNSVLVELIFGNVEQVYWLGCWEIPPDPIMLTSDPLKFELVQEDFGIDFFNDTAEITYKGQSFNVSTVRKQQHWDTMIRREIYYLALKTKQALERNRADGRFVLYFQISKLRWDYQVIANLYKSIWGD